MYRNKTAANAYASKHGIGHHPSWLLRSRYSLFLVASVADKLHQDFLGLSKRLQLAMITVGGPFGSKSRCA